MRAMHVEPGINTGNRVLFVPNKLPMSSVKDINFINNELLQCNRMSGMLDAKIKTNMNTDELRPI